MDERRAERLKQALRDNLRRRKAVARPLVREAPATPGEEAPSGCDNGSKNGTG